MSRKKIIFISFISLTTIFTAILICFAVLEGVSYHAATRLADTIQEEDMQILLNDPSIQSYINEKDEIATMNLSETDLPIKTRSEAITKVTQTFTNQDIKDLSTKLKKGLTEKDKEELMDTVNQHFSEEEILSLKILALQELKKRESQSQKQ
ncbi:hypothetical protein [Cytobacillus sp. FSL K6-0265]|uniref:hypothetical protein n=1 Tax=Cytobacillus sp. FSL K6-0265 TaxID=2921448 RepID=UPI0030F8F99B